MYVTPWQPLPATNVQLYLLLMAKADAPVLVAVDFHVRQPR
jgi:hypothetical protein